MISHLEIFSSLSKERRFGGPENFSGAQGGREEKKVENHCPRWCRAATSLRQKITAYILRHLAAARKRAPAHLGMIAVAEKATIQFKNPIP